MPRLFYLTTLLLSGAYCHASAQTMGTLRNEIQQIIAAKDALVGVAIMGPTGKDTLSIRGGEHFPLQSVFKFHIALAVLARVDKGDFSLAQPIKIEKKDLLPTLYSPLRDKYPNGATLPLSTIIEYTVSESDNVGCDLLLRLIGGPQAVEDYFKANKCEEVAIKINEETMQATWASQFQNWTTPRAANHVLAAFYHNEARLLSKKSHAFIWNAMKATTTGPGRLKGQLPKHTVVAHKTGSSGANEQGVTAAVNDIGVVFLPEGQPYFISVLVTNSREDANANEQLIADISKATWDYFTSKTKKTVASPGSNPTHSGQPRKR